MQFTNTFLDPRQGTRQKVNYGDVRTIGVEVEANVRPVDFFELSGTATFQYPKFKNYSYKTLVGSQLVSTSFR